MAASIKMAVDLVLKNCSKSTVEHFSNVPAVLFSEKTKVQKKNPLWQEKFKIAGKNQDGIKCAFFLQKTTVTPPIRKLSNSF
jgi:hypothetical protein